MVKEYITNLIKLIKIDIEKHAIRVKTLNDINNIHTLRLNEAKENLNKLSNNRIILESLQLIKPLDQFEKLYDLLRNNSTQIHIYNKIIKNQEELKKIIDFLIQVRNEKKELLDKLLDKLIIFVNNN